MGFNANRNEYEQSSSLGAEAGETLGVALQKIAATGRLESLYLKNMEFSSSDYFALGKGLVANSLNLRSLCLTGCLVEKGCPSSVFQEHMIALTDLDMFCMNLDFEDAQIISLLLPNMSQLQKLDQSLNSLGLQGCNAVLEAISEMGNCIVDLEHADIERD